MSKCADCIHSQICEILSKAKTFSKKIDGAVVGITACDHYLYDSGFCKTESANVQTSSILDKLGLGENNYGATIQLLAADAPTTSNIVEDGKICPCCENLLEQDKFEGEVCNECGQEVCVDCAITTDDDIVLCEKCF